MASSCLKLFSVIFIVVSFCSIQAFSAAAVYQNLNGCSAEEDECNNKSKALTLKLIAIFTILVTSLVGVCLPLLSRSMPALRPDGNLFIIVKAFASGIILGTSFMHVLPDSFDFLSSECLDENPWHKFPFTGFVAMISSLLTLMVDSLTTSIYTKKLNNGIKPDTEPTTDIEMTANMQFHGHTHNNSLEASAGAHLLRYRVVALVLEMGIVVHSVVIGLSLGASNSTCTIKPLVAAICFHQLFEGMGLGGCIAQAEYKMLKTSIMVFFFSVTTPFGIALGIALSSSYDETSPRSLITVGLLNAASAGLLIYMALVDLLAADFMGKKLQGNIKLQLKCYVAAFLGAGGMSLMAKWA